MFSNMPPGAGQEVELVRVEPVLARQGGREPDQVAEPELVELALVKHVPVHP